MKITHVDVQLAGAVGQDRCKAYCTVTIDECFVVRDIKIIEGPQGFFVAMPSRKITAPCGRCRAKNHLSAKYCNECGGRLTKPGNGERIKLFCDVAHPITLECRKAIEERILAEYERAANVVATSTGVVA